jgi:hypothetical protein
MVEPNAAALRYDKVSVVGTDRGDATGQTTNNLGAAIGRPQVSLQCCVSDFAEATADLNHD